MRIRELVFALAIAPAWLAAAPGPKTQNVVFVMMDGLRWQEVFLGADSQLMNKENGAVGDPAGLEQQYPVGNRAALMPFMWNVVAKQGQLYGNRKAGSEAYVTNGKNFSYPGYSETLCGFPDDRIDSNRKIPNPNRTVLEWLNDKPAFRGSVAVFGAWDNFPYMVNSQRSGLPVNAGFEPLVTASADAPLALMNRLKAESVYWESEPADAFTFHTAMWYLKHNQPRVLYLSLGEADEWSHAGKYGPYLGAIHRTDAYLKELWNTLQSMDQYRGKTTLIFSVDHGRGEAPVEWRSHGQKIPDSKYIFMTFLGPDTPPLGERKEIAPVTQSQLAATLAALLGEDYHADVPKSGAPIADVIGH
ncbi:MAG: hypothetical protein IT160_15600 [Bryobacterales bacterium]|nr:hypothetical protein [Bryobacterales bacterium]